MQAKQAKQAKQATQAAAPVAQASAPQPQAVALRGGLALTAVVLTSKPYRAAAKHNIAWHQLVQQACQQGSATVSAITALGVPTHFVGYLYRNGHLAQAPEVSA